MCHSADRENSLQGVYPVPKQPIIYCRYRDHVLFRNVRSRMIRPVEREAVGWLVVENVEYIVLVGERTPEKLPRLREIGESGLLILRHDVIEIRSLKDA